MENGHKNGRIKNRNGKGQIAPPDVVPQEAIDALGEILELVPDNQKGASESSWTGVQWAVIVWVATPVYARIPKNQKDLADKLGVSEQTISNWKRRSDFWVEVRAISRSYLERDLPDIYAALGYEAKKGSYYHIKLALELLGEYVEQHDLTFGGKPFPVQTYDYSATVTQLTGRPESSN